jgi:PAS domain S-box-containing protein
MMADYFEHEVLGARRPFDKEYRITRISDGGERRVHGAGRIDTDDAGAVVRMIGTIQDVTERRLAEQRIIESGERYRALIEHSPLAVFVNRADRVELANAACAALFLAESPEELLGMSVFDLFHPDDRDQVARRIERLRSFGTPVPRVSERIVRLDGEHRYADVSAAPFKQGDETLIHVVLRDTTDERAAEEDLQRHQEKLSELASELIRTSERERHRLAVELHDSVGQALAAAKISARTVVDSTSDTGDTGESGRLLELLDYSIRHVRALTAQLSPPALYELGLVPALERLVEDLRSLYGIDCALSIEHAPESVPEDARPILFRAARELLSNVHRHAGVDAARLTLEERYNSAILRVEDEGSGFNTSAIDAGACTDCFGLFSLKEEVRNAGGTVIIRSTPDSGTSVEVSVPLG